MSSTIEDRFILLLRHLSEDDDLNDEKNSVTRIKSALGISPARGRPGFWKYLDQYTGISSQRWGKVYARRQRPTSDMIEALAKLQPEYAFWLATGITDATNGHIAPMTAQTFPERLFCDDTSSTRYFREQIDLFEKLFQEAGIDVNDENMRMTAAERTYPLAHWWDSLILCDKAYALSATKEYAKLKELWKKREKDREARINYITKPDERPWSLKRKELLESGLKGTPTLGQDPRTEHQDQWDLFYIPSKKKSKK